MIIKAFGHGKFNIGRAFEQATGGDLQAHNVTSSSCHSCSSRADSLTPHLSFTPSSTKINTSPKDILNTTTTPANSYIQ